MGRTCTSYSSSFDAQCSSKEHTCFLNTLVRVGKVSALGYSLSSPKSLVIF